MSTEPTPEQIDRVLTRAERETRLHAVRFRVSANAAYCPDTDPTDPDPQPWCVEVGHSGSEPEYQGWGPDPLAAALACAERAFAALALDRGDFASESGGLTG